LKGDDSMALNSGTLPTATNSDVAQTQFNLVTSAINNATPWEIVDGGTGENIKSSAFNALAPSTTKGDIPIYNASGVHGRFTVSSVDNLMLVSNSGTHSGYNLISSTIGKQTIWVPVEAMSPAGTNGCSSLTLVDSGGNNVEYNVLDFDTSSDEYAHFNIKFPNGWNEGTITFRVSWTTTATDTDGVAWGLQAVAVSDNDTINAAYGTAIVVTDDNQSAAGDELVTSESSALTIAGTPAAGDTIEFRIFRDVSNANDDMTEDARLRGVEIFFTLSSANDS